MSSQDAPQNDSGDFFLPGRTRGNQPQICPVVGGVTRSMRLVVRCRTTSASTAPCIPRRICCLTHCASYCAMCQPLLRAFPRWMRSPPSTRGNQPQICSVVGGVTSLRFALLKEGLLASDLPGCTRGNQPQICSVERGVISLRFAWLYAG